MIRVVRSTVLPRPLAAVWDVLRDFNGHADWHPAVAESRIERGRPSDVVGCVRRFKLADGAELREQLLALSDATTTLRYALLDTPIPLLNYVASVRLVPVTDGDATFWQWSCSFDTLPGQEEAMTQMVATQIYEAGFSAVRNRMESR